MCVCITYIYILVAYMYIYLKIILALSSEFFRSKLIDNLKLYFPLPNRALIFLKQRQPQTPPIFLHIISLPLPY